MGVPLHWNVAIGLDNVSAAERIYDRLEKRAATLREPPRLGQSPYLSFYETPPDSDSGPIERVEIVRVVDGRRDLPSLF